MDNYSDVLKHLRQYINKSRIQDNHYFVGTRTLKETLTTLKELGNTYHRAISPAGRKLDYYHIRRDGEPLFHLYVNTYESQLDGEIIVAPKTSFVLGNIRYDYGIK